MKTKYIIITLIIVLVILFFVQKKEHAGSVPAAAPQLSNEAIQNIAKVYADTNNTATFNNLKSTGKTTLNNLDITGTIKIGTKGGDLDTYFVPSADTNYIRGKTIVDGASFFTNTTRFKSSDGQDIHTWFPHDDGNNYIRGLTKVDGDLYANKTLYYNKIKTGNAENRPGTAGGGGGGGYNIYCPEGTVMIGITGGAGGYVDRVGPICK